jgi:hypothetical protein
VKPLGYQILSVTATMRFLALSALILPLADGYKNVTLTSLHGDLAVTVFLPGGPSDDEKSKPFYSSTRFEYGSMIGSIRRTRLSRYDRRGHSEEIDLPPASHEFYGPNLWRLPHDPYWPESGIGLASEFGVGDNGDFCTYRCGWHQVGDVTNGVLGYQGARIGESFLKIGVGELIKGSCQSCDSTGDYMFNSPYEFAKEPKWHITQPADNTVIMEHEARLSKFGYKLKKEVLLVDNQLRVKSTLTNLGADAFKTAWYSHHFFSCDGNPIGPGYSADLYLHEENIDHMYDEPGLATWSLPLHEYARVKPIDNRINIELRREVEDGIRIKAEFQRDQGTKGAFALHGCGTTIVEDITEFTEFPYDPINMYAFNVYIERGTLSPEPQLLISLKPNESKSWTQRLMFHDLYVNTDKRLDMPTTELLPAASLRLQRPTIKRSTLSHMTGVGILVLLIGFVAFLRRQWAENRRRNSTYAAIPDDS